MERTIFDEVRENTRRIEELTRYVRGDAEWNQPGVLILLQLMQVRQAKNEYRTLVHLVLLVMILFLALAILAVLILHLRAQL